MNSSTSAAAATATSLETLNDDCLLLICAQLAIGDQFALLQLGGRLRQLVLAIWRRKYAIAFDWQREPQLKCLSAREQSQLLGHMSRLTRALLNLSVGEHLPAWLSGSLQRKRTRKRIRMPHMQRLSFRACSSAALLRQLPRICENLGQLQLGAFDRLTPAELSTLFAQLPRLSLFELLPGSICGAPAAALADIEYCQTLQTLKLPACALRAAGTQIARMPQLRQLTGFLCSNTCLSSSNIDDDKAQPNAGTVATATISACLTALSVGKGGAGGVACQIVGLHLQCQLDARLPRLLTGHLSVVRLERFAWHSQLMVHYDATDGSIKWLPQAPQVASAMLRFIVSQAASLRELDFMRNVHATPTFLKQLTEQLGPPSELLAVWHDACPRARMSDEETDKDSSRNDLAFVELELKMLSNEKANC